MKKDEKLTEDNDTPFSQPDDVHDQIEDTSPQTDSNIDLHEKYDEGLEGASESSIANDGRIIQGDISMVDDDTSFDDDEDDDDDMKVEEEEPINEDEEDMEEE